MSAVVPLGIEPGDWHQRVDPERLEAIQRRFPGPRVLFVGRLRYYKGLDYLISAMEQVEAQLLVVGDGRQRAALERQAHGSPAARRIHFLGDVPQAELPSYYAAADVLALPSSHRSEAFGLVLLEAMACGTPVVSTELLTGTSYTNRDGETGWVVPPRDANALADALRACLADPERGRMMGARGRQRVQTEFGAELMVERVLQVYADALGEERAAGEPAA